MGFADPASTPKTAESTLALTEAGDQLIRYMNIVANNDIIQSVASSNISDITAGIQPDREADLYNRIIKDIVLQLNTQDTPTTDAINTNAQKTTEDGSKTTAKVIALTPEDFGQMNNSRSSLGESNDNVASTKLTHYAIINSGKEFNYTDRGAEYVAIFCNLMPSVQLSLCIPHFKVSFTQVESQQTADFIPFLSLDSFLGAGQENTASSTITSQNTLPAAHKTFPLYDANSRIGTQTSGMELFLSPQTLINPDINTTAIYQNTRGVTVLDPMQPLMSIESIGIDANPIGRNFMTTNLIVSLSIVLHDRSRLAEIAPLISPSLRPSLRAEVEFGWNHPDGELFSDNPYAKFLNALKSKQVFTVTQATVSSRDASSLTVKLTLTSLGTSVSSGISTYTGEYIEYLQAEEKLKQLFRIIETSGNSGTATGAQSTTQIRIGEEVTVSTSTYEVTDKWIKYSDYVKITDLVNNNLTRDKVDQLVDTYKNIIQGVLNGDADNNTTSIVPRLRTRMLNDLRSHTWNDSSYYSKVIDSEELRDYFKTTIMNYFLNDEGVSYHAASGELNNETPAVVMLGDIIYRMLSIPMGLGRFFDEIRVTTFDLNDHAGAMGGMNIGSIPVKISRLSDNDSILTSRLTCKEIIERVLDTVADPAYEPYGIKAAQARKTNMETKVGDSKDQANAANPTAEEIQAAYEKTLSNIYTKKSKMTKFAGISYEPKFLKPELKFEMVVVPVNDGNSIKHVMCVFVYDDANTGKSSTNLILTALKKPAGITKVLNAAADINTQNTSIFNVKKSSDGQYDVSVNKSTVNNFRQILSAAYPTIKIGAEGSVIINASYSTVTSGNVDNALQYQSAAQAYTGTSGTTTSSAVNASMYLMPSTVTISMLGMPLLNRGQNYYIDFGTGTSIDNVYTVTTVKHTIKGGQFTTNATLVLTNAATLSSVITKIRESLSAVDQFSKIITPS